MPRPPVPCPYSLAHACPTCNAAIGEWCVCPGGRLNRVGHRARRELSGPVKKRGQPRKRTVVRHKPGEGFAQAALRKIVEDQQS